MDGLMYIEHYIDLHNYISDKLVNLDDEIIYESLTDQISSTFNKMNPFKDFKDIKINISKINIMKSIGNFLKNIYRFIIKMFHYLTRWFTVNKCKQLQKDIKSNLEEIKFEFMNHEIGWFLDNKYINLLSKKYKNFDFIEKDFKEIIIELFRLSKSFKTADSNRVINDSNTDPASEKIAEFYGVKNYQGQKYYFIDSLINSKDLNKFEDHFNKIKKISQNLIIIMMGWNFLFKQTKHQHENIQQSLELTKLLDQIKIALNFDDEELIRQLGVEDLSDVRESLYELMMQTKIEKKANDLHIDTVGYISYIFTNNIDKYLIKRIDDLIDKLNNINNDLNNKNYLKLSLEEIFITPISKILNPLKSQCLDFDDNINIRKKANNLINLFFLLAQSMNDKKIKEICSKISDFYKAIQKYSKIFFYYPKFLEMLNLISSDMLKRMKSRKEVWDSGDKEKINKGREEEAPYSFEEESTNIYLSESNSFINIIIDNFDKIFKGTDWITKGNILLNVVKFSPVIVIPVTVAFNICKWLFTRNNLDNEIKKTYKYLYQLKSKKIKLSDSQIKLIIHNEDYKDLKLTAESIKIIVRDINEMLEKHNDTSASNPVFNLLGLPKSSYRYRATFMVHCFYINLLIFAINYKKIPINVRLNLLISLINYMDRLGTIKEPNPLNKLAILVNSSMSKLMGSLYKYIHPIIDYIAKNKTNLDEETVKANLEELDKYENKPKKLVTLLKGKSLKDRLKDGLKLMNEYFGLFANLKSFLALIKDILQLSSAIDNHQGGRYANKDRSDEDQELIDDNDYEEDY